MKIDLLEIGKTISAATAGQIRAAITALEALLATPESPADATAAESLTVEAAMRHFLQEAEMSFDDIRTTLRTALSALDLTKKRWYYIKDVYPSYFVYEDEAPIGAGQVTGIFKRSYTILDGKVTLGDPVQVVQVTTYVPVGTATSEAIREALEAQLSEKKIDPNVGGGVDRSKIPAEDFAGPNNSFPIVIPKDVTDAAALIGKAGDPEAVKKNIIAICKRKGASFMAKLPAAWMAAMPSAKMMGAKEAATETPVVGEDGKCSMARDGKCSMMATMGKGMMAGAKMQGGKPMMGGMMGAKESAGDSASTDLITDLIESEISEFVPLLEAGK